MSKATAFERIAASVPQNATAATVVSQKGEHWQPKINTGTRLHSDLPIPTRPIPAISMRTCADLPGKKVGRLTVIGLAAQYNPKKKAGWVVRCVCGAYEIRKAPALRNPENGDDCCAHCQHLEIIRKRYKRLGGMSLEELAERSR